MWRSYCIANLLCGSLACNKVTNSNMYAYRFLILCASQQNICEPNMLSWVLLWWMLQVSVLHEIDMSRHLFHFYFMVLSSVRMLWLDCFTVILKQIDVQNVANAAQKSYTNARKDVNEKSFHVAFTLPKIKNRIFKTSCHELVAC
jgi:hypothetical protein